MPRPGPPRPDTWSMSPWGARRPTASCGKAAGGASNRARSSTPPMSPSPATAVPTATQFVRAVVPHGTTGMFIDPHEIANVFGLRGVRMMVDEAALQPIHVWVQMPSCVPSAPGLETPGAAIGPAEVAEAMTWPGVIGLGERMNFPGVCSGDAGLHAEMAEARRAGKVIGGHYASPDLGLPFHGYAAGGPEDDHE